MLKIKNIKSVILSAMACFTGLSGLASASPAQVDVFDESDKAMANTGKIPSAVIDYVDNDFPNVVVAVDNKGFVQKDGSTDLSPDINLLVNYDMKVSGNDVTISTSLVDESYRELVNAYYPKVLVSDSDRANVVGED